MMTQFCKGHALVSTHLDTDTTSTQPVMGEEYKIKFRSESAEQTDKILREAPHFSQYLPQYEQYEYRVDPNGNLYEMPHVSAGLLPEGFYFCVHVRNSQVPSHVLAYLEGVIIKAGQASVVEDLE